MFDVVIVGGGIAGCAAALEVRRSGMSAVVLSGVDHNHRVESLPATTAASIRSWIGELGHPLDRVIASWGGETAVIEDVRGALLASHHDLLTSFRQCLIPYGVPVRPIARVTEAQRSMSGWYVSFLTRESQKRSVRGRHLVDATGRASAVSRFVGSQRIHRDQLFCISSTANIPGTPGVWTESTHNGWWNLCRLPEQSTLSFYSDAPTIRTARRDPTVPLSTTFMIQPYISQGPLHWTTWACGSSYLEPAAGPAWTAIGDAASTFHPLASAGISKALRDARMLRAAMGDHRRYEEVQRADFEKYWANLGAQYRTEHRWEKEPFWRRMGRAA